MGKSFQRIRLALALLLLACVASLTHAQQKPVPVAGNYPHRPVRVLVGSTPGSGVDVVIRIVAVKLGERWGQSLVIDNRAGAVGAIALDLAAHSVPDGYTLITVSGQTITAMLLKTVSTDIRTAFVPVVELTRQPYMLVVTPSLPVSSVKELIAYARAKPLIYASTGTGSAVHLGMELFKSRAGIDMVHVPYKGSGQSIIDVVSGRVQVTITNSNTATTFARSGKVRMLAVTTPKRSPALPDLPTISEAGVPGYELESWYGLFAPAKTSPAIVLAINREVNQVINTTEMKDRLAANGAEPAQPNTPAEFKTSVAREISKWEKFLETSGFKLDPH